MATIKLCGAITSRGESRVHSAFSLRTPLAYALLRVCVGLLCILTGLASADEIPSFTSLQRPLKSDLSWPHNWNAIEGVAWHTELEGYGQSTPLVSSNSIFVTSVAGEQKNECLVTSIDRSTGSIRWVQRFTNPTPEENSSYVSRAAPTGVLVDDGIVAFFEGGLLVSLNQNGETRWEKNLVAEYGAIHARHGLAASLESYANRLFCWVERDENPFVLCLESRTGSEIWRSSGIGVTSWATPRIVPVDENNTHLVLSGLGIVAGIDPANGERLWATEDVVGNSTCTPVPTTPGTFLLGSSTSGQGKIGNTNALVRIERSDQSTWRVHFAWRGVKASSSFGSPMVTDKYAYFVNKSGILFRINLATGTEGGTLRLSSGSIWAPPLRHLDTLYFFGHKGVTSIVSESQFAELRTNDLFLIEQSKSSNSIVYAAVAVDGEILIRTGSEIFCVSNPE